MSPPIKEFDMSVAKGDRKESKVEFDDAYFKIYKDCVRLSQNNFGGEKEIAEKYSDYLKVISSEVLVTVCEIGRNIRIANSIFPCCRSEYEVRRISQEKAIGLCFDLLTKYQLTMKLLEVKDNKFVDEINNIKHEINCIKKWRTSDNARFKNLG